MWKCAPCLGRYDKIKKVVTFFVVTDNILLRFLKGFLQQNTTANKYATRVESLPEEDNFAIFYSSVECEDKILYIY